jgi:hypothetical protein
MCTSDSQGAGWSCGCNRRRGDASLTGCRLWRRRACRTSIASSGVKQRLPLTGFVVEHGPADGVGEPSIEDSQSFHAAVVIEFASSEEFARGWVHPWRCYHDPV